MPVPPGGLVIGDGRWPPGGLVVGGGGWPPGGLVITGGHWPLVVQGQAAARPLDRCSCTSQWRCR